MINSLSVTQTQKSAAAKHKPYRLVLHGPARPLLMLREIPRSQKVDHFSRQKTNALERRLEWHQFSDVLGMIEVDSANVRQLLKDEKIKLPAGCVMIQVQSFMGIAAKFPYTTDGFVYITDAGMLDRNTAKDLFDEQLRRDYGVEARKEEVSRLCHGDIYVSMLRNVMMVCPIRTWDVIASRDTYPEVRRAETPLRPVEQDDIDMLTAAVASIPPRRPLLSVARRPA